MIKGEKLVLSIHCYNALTLLDIKYNIWQYKNYSKQFDQSYICNNSQMTHNLQSLKTCKLKAECEMFQNFQIYKKLHNWFIYITIDIIICCSGNDPYAYTMKLN